MSSEALRLADLLESLSKLAIVHSAASLLRTQAARIASLEAERDQLRAEVERLRKPLTDEQIKAACSDIYLSDYPQGSSSYDVALARAIEAAKEAK